MEKLNFTPIDSYHPQWIPKFSESIPPLVTCSEFPLKSKLLSIFIGIKDKTEISIANTVQNYLLLVVETNVSEHAVAASHN